MNSPKADMFLNRLTKVFKHREKVARKQNISCYRIYDLDMPEFPLCIDKYGEYIHVSEYKRNHILNDLQYDEWLYTSIEIISNVTDTVKENIFVKERKIIKTRTEQYTKNNETKNETIIEENGYKLLVNFHDYLDTGIFLDHRMTRKMVGDNSKGKRVLNLFAYTGSFSLYAAMNGAAEIHTIDLSNTYINWAKRNFIANDLNPNDHIFTVADVMKILPELPQLYFDIIICDPPTFSNSKKMDGILDTQKDHVWMINQCIQLLTRDGKLFFSTNYSKFKIDTENIHSDHIKDITRQTTPFDFEGKLNRFCYLIST